jgi:hypothetical protein
VTKTFQVRDVGDACRKASLPEREHQLREAELDQVAAAGGKGTTSSNPVED